MNGRRQGEAQTLAHAFLDIAQITEKFQRELLPRLFDPDQTRDQLDATLTEIGEVCRKPDKPENPRTVN